MQKLTRPHLQFAIETLHVIIARTPQSVAVLQQDGILFDAMLMRLQEAGEHLAAIRQFDPEYYQTHATEEWHRLIGLRNIISHGYRDIDPAIVWDVLANRLPEFVRRLEVLDKSQ